MLALISVQRCLTDLRQRFAKIRIQVSPPIVPFRETAVDTSAIKSTKVTIPVLDGVLKLTISTRILPRPVVAFLLARSDLIKRLFSDKTSENVETTQKPAIETARQERQGFTRQLSELFTAAEPEWASLVDKIHAFGPRVCGPNLLIDRSGQQKIS